MVHRLFVMIGFVAPCVSYSGLLKVRNMICSEEKSKVQ